MRNKKLFQRLMAVVMCSTLLATTPVMTYATTNTAKISSEIATQAEADENGFVIEDGVLIKCTKDVSEITIPSGVITIGKQAFADCFNLEKAIIPNGVTTIEDEAFRDCGGMTSIVIPESVTSIGNNVFVIVIGNDDTGEDSYLTYPVTLSVVENSYAHKYAIVNNISYEFQEQSNEEESDFEIIGGTLIRYEGNESEVEIPNGVTHIGNNAFANNSKIKKVVIPDGVTGIGYSAFQGCTALTEVQFSKSITRIVKDTFRDCTSLQSIELPEGLTSIEERVFWNCTNLKNINIPSSITRMGSYAFKNTAWLTNLKADNNGMITAGHCLIDGTACTGEVIIPESVSVIAESAFYQNDSITKVVIPDGVTEIGYQIFSECINLDEITIPISVESIKGEHVDFSAPFYGCEKLSVINYNGTKEQWNEINLESLADSLPFQSCPSITVKCTDGSLVYDTEGNVTEDNVLNDFNKALEDEDVEYAITLLQNVDNEMLIEKLQTDADFAKKVAELEKSYQNEYTITVTSKSEVENVDASKVSIVGAALNAPGDSRPRVVELSIKTPVNAVEVPSKYSNKLLLDITLLIDEVAQESLSVPVTITMPIPSGVSKEKLVILHYHANATEPTVLTPVINADNTMTFIVDKFSTFVVANDTSEDTGSSNNNGNDNSDNTGSSGSNGNGNSDNTGSSDNNENNSTNKPSPDTGDSLPIFMYIALGMMGALFITYKKIRKA